mgnify:CR=1 FL=1
MPIINASELGEYSYCRRAWWLGRVQGLSSRNLAALARGQALHELHGRRAQRAIRFRRVALGGLLLASSLIVIGFYLLLTWGGRV